MQESVSRLYYMDAMRSVLMMLGIFSHTSYIYHSSIQWQINSSEHLLLLDWLSSAQLSFRMQAFFAISGFFCALTLSRYSVVKFLRVRLVRIALPMLITGATLNMFQNIFLDSRDLYNFTFTGHFFAAEWVSHLWFLRNLVFYFLIAAIVVAVFRPLLLPLNNLLGRMASSINIYVLISGLPLVSVAVLSLTVINFPLHEKWLFGVLHWYQLMVYLPFFVVGVFFYTLPELLRRFTAVSAIVMCIQVAVGVALIHWTKTGESLFHNAVYGYAYALIGWSFVVLTFKLFQRFFNKPSKIWAFFSDASYTIYLFHHLFVILIGIVVLHFGGGPIVGLFLIMAATFAVTVCIHIYFVSRVPLARYLFNGK